MLVLTRKVDEELVLTVGDVKVCVRVVKLTNHRAKIGIKAPRSVRVDRGEVHRRRQDNRPAA